MRIRINLSALHETSWHEYLIRLVLGGAITVVAGLIAKHFGPGIGGLFLAFPAIFPATATLVESHERDKKRRAGIPHTIRGRLAAALDARGTAMGTVALVAFAVLVWRALPSHNALWVLLAALCLWLVLAVLLWRLRKLHVFMSWRRKQRVFQSGAR